MVSTRRNGSLPENKKRSSSPSDDSSKPSSPKRQKGESSSNNMKNHINGSNSKSSGIQLVENPKKISSNDPPELPAATAAAASISDAIPVIAEGATAAVDDKPRNSFTSWKQLQGFETNTPWCRLLSESPLKPTISVRATNFSVGSSKKADLLIRDQTNSAISCSLRLTQHVDKPVAVLESCGNKGRVKVNGRAIKKNSSYYLNSGDEVVFGYIGSHAYW
ncbi:uncharacterized protein LOC142528219 [Primulina tabacum]|uniref:uncharacterized protein LOC142528219 n=1 Tax=Primulina tabacum TaxID=48773 RepID=UPI003F59EC9E